MRKILMATAAAVGLLIGASSAFADEKISGFLTAPHPGDLCGKATIVLDSPASGSQTVAVAWRLPNANPGQALPDPSAPGKWTSMQSFEGKHVTVAIGADVDCKGNSAQGETPPGVIHIYESPTAP
jgi:hypothetical protein